MIRLLLENPRRMLTALCAAVGVPWDEAMLRWERGRRATDGVWAKHWYANVEKTTTFQPYAPKPEPVPPHLTGLLDVCQSHYETLHRHRLARR